MVETLRGRLINLDDEVFQLETDQGERIVFTLLEGSGVQPHDLEGIVRSPVRIEITIQGPHEHATATRVEPCEQYHPGPPLPLHMRRRAITADLPEVPPVHGKLERRHELSR